MASLPPERRVGTVIFNDDHQVILDATLSDAFSMTFEVTDDVIEDGSSTSDHIAKKPDSFSAEGIISRVGLGPVDPDNPARLEAIRNELIALGNDRVAVTVVNDLWVLDGYAITSLRFPRSQGQGYSLGVSLEFKQLRTTAAQTTQIQPTDTASAFQEPLTDLTLGGTQTPSDSEGSEIKDEVEEAHESHVHSFLRGR